MNLGEDTDTVAAVVGGLAGLYYGFEDIPTEWFEQIANRELVEDLSNKLQQSLLRRSIEKLTAFIPYFENVDKDNACHWGGGEKLGEKHYTMPFPVYEQTLEDFLQTVYQSNLLSYNYLEIIAQYGLDGTHEMKAAIEQADLELTFAILTGYIRQERFCDGLWQSDVEDKTFLRLLRRLANIMTS